MFGSSTDLLMRRFMQRVSKPVFIGSAILIGILLALPWLPTFLPDWLKFIGGFYPFIAAFPVGGAAVLLVVEIGKISYRSQWDPPSIWISFFVALCSSIATLFYYCEKIAVREQIAGMSHIGGWMIVSSLVMLFAFLIKFYAVVARERLLEKLYFLLLVIACLLTFWCYLIGVVTESGNPMDIAPWK